MNGYNLSGKMKRAPNSDSKTHVKKQNPTSRTEIRRKSLKYLFLETPCISFTLHVYNKYIYTIQQDKVATIPKMLSDWELCASYSLGLFTNV